MTSIPIPGTSMSDKGRKDGLGMASWLTYYLQHQDLVCWLTKYSFYILTSPQREDGYRRVKSSISCFGPPFTYEPYTQECYECSSGQSCGQPSSPVGRMRDHPLTIATWETMVHKMPQMTHICAEKICTTGQPEENTTITGMQMPLKASNHQSRPPELPTTKPEENK